LTNSAQTDNLQPPLTNRCHLQKTYLDLLLLQYKPVQSLASSASNLLALPSTTPESGRCTFSYSASSI